MFKKYKIGKGVSIIFLFSVILITILYSFDRYINKKLESQLVTSINDISDQNIKLIQNVINTKLNLLNSIAKEFSDYTEEEIADSHEYTEEISERFGFRELGLAFDGLINKSETSNIKEINDKAIEDIKNGINNNISGYTKYQYNQYKYAVYSPLNINGWFLITVVPVDILIERILPINNIIH